MLLQQGVLRKEHLLTHMAAVPGQRGSITILTGSEEGKLNVTFGFGLLDKNKHSHDNSKFLTSCCSPRGYTATLKMVWRNSWSITGQSNEKLTSICFLRSRIFKLAGLARWCICRLLPTKLANECVTIFAVMVIVKTKIHWYLCSEKTSFVCNGAALLTLSNITT